MGIGHVATFMAITLLAGDGEFDLDSEPVRIEVPAQALSPVCADDAEPLKPADEVERLRKIWIGWKERATSIEVEGFEFFGILRDEDSQVSRASLQKLIEETLPKLVADNPDLDLDALNAATAKQFPVNKDKSSSFGRWAEISLVRAADCVRCTMVVDGHPMTTVRRGPLEQNYSPSNRQVDVYPKNSGLYAPEIDKFIYGPTRTVDSVRWQSLDAKSAKRRLSFYGPQGSAAELEYDAVTGAVSYDGLRLSETQYRREHYQTTEVFTRNGIPVPRLQADITYDQRSEKSRVIRIYVIKSVEVGHEIGRDRFNLRVPLATNVILYDDAPGSHPPVGRPPMARTKKVEEDAAEFTRSDEFKGAQRK